MKRPSITKDGDYNITSKTVEKAQREAERVTKILEQINSLRDKLYQIKEESDWSNYLGIHSQDKLTDDEKFEFFKAFEIIKYGYEKSKEI